MTSSLLAGPSDEETQSNEEDQGFQVGTAVGFAPRAKAFRHKSSTAMIAAAFVVISAWPTVWPPAQLPTG